MLSKRDDRELVSAAPDGIGVIIFRAPRPATPRHGAAHDRAFQKPCGSALTARYRRTPIHRPMDPDRHPTACTVCLVSLTPRDSGAGRPKLYCSSTCKSRARRHAEQLDRANSWAAKGRVDIAERIRRRADRTLELWRRAA
jgi:hypothetical protein